MPILLLWHQQKSFCSPSNEIIIRNFSLLFPSSEDISVPGFILDSSGWIRPSDNAKLFWDFKIYDSAKAARESFSMFALTTAPLQKYSLLNDNLGDECVSSQDKPSCAIWFRRYNIAIKVGGVSKHQVDNSLIDAVEYLAKRKLNSIETAASRVRALGCASGSETLIPQFTIIPVKLKSGDLITIKVTCSSQPPDDLVYTWEWDKLPNTRFNNFSPQSEYSYNAPTVEQPELFHVKVTAYDNRNQYGSVEGEYTVVPNDYALLTPEEQQAAISQLKSKLQSSNTPIDEIDPLIAKALETKDESFVPIYLKFLGRVNDPNQTAAIQALGAMHSIAAVQDLVTFYSNSQDENLRRDAVFALYDIASAHIEDATVTEKVIPLLEKASYDTDETVRESAQNLLRQLRESLPNNIPFRFFSINHMEINWKKDEPGFMITGQVTLPDNYMVDDLQIQANLKIIIAKENSSFLIRKQTINFDQGGPIWRYRVRKPEITLPAEGIRIKKMLIFWQPEAAQDKPGKGHRKRIGWFMIQGNINVSNGDQATLVPKASLTLNIPVENITTTSSLESTATVDFTIQKKHWFYKIPPSGLDYKENWWDDIKDED